MAALYLLDANTLIDANRDYYGIGQVDEYWEWLVHFGEQGRIKIPVEIYEELRAGSDALAAWAKQEETETALRFAEEVDIALVRRVTEEGYAVDLTDIEIEEIGRDPFLIAYALADPENRVIVTTERSKPRAQRKNRKVPDVCAQFGIRPCNAFTFGREMGFRTDWRDQI
ncbi:DUF4411 family protein [Aliiroseovarius sp. YM-037]|uniref:DUF4411 family protein n=1 Tax=Aliiroseovarius sp. YM-037 TaxID=3341728 RepID=UPI003A800D48